MKTPEPLLEQGHLVATEQLVFPQQHKKLHIPSEASLDIVKNKNGTVFSGKDFSITINEQTGLITSLNYSNNELLKAASHPEFWRAPVYNDLEDKNYASRFAVWQKLGRNTELTDIKIGRASCRERV